MNKHKKYDTYFMDLAKRTAEMSYAKRRKVGAILVKDGHVISQGWNGNPSGMPNKCEDDTTNKTLPSVIHAETNAIAKVAKSSYSSEGAILYITLSPCYSCAKLIIQSGVKEVVFLTEYRDTGGLFLLRKSGVQTRRFYGN